MKQVIVALLLAGMGPGVANAGVEQLAGMPDVAYMCEMPLSPNRTAAIAVLTGERKVYWQVSGPGADGVRHEADLSGATIAPMGVTNAFGHFKWSKGIFNFRWPGGNWSVQRSNDMQGASFAWIGSDYFECMGGTSDGHG